MRVPQGTFAEYVVMGGSTATSLFNKLHVAFLFTGFVSSGVAQDLKKWDMMFYVMVECSRRSTDENQT